MNDEPTFEQQTVAYELLEEMCAHRLEVVLIPAPRPMHCMHCIRVAVSRNPKWYREYFAQQGYLDCRLLRKALARMAHGYEPKHVYDNHALAVIDARLEITKEEDMDDSRTDDTRRDPGGDAE